VSRPTALERLEVAAEDAYGRGAAVSVDREEPWVVVRVWNARGAQTHQAKGSTRQACCNMLLRELDPLVVAVRKAREGA
jgi:hypothetical protein